MGALSVATTVSTEWSFLVYIVMMSPPPRPELSLFMTPRHRRDVMAPSTAEPPFCKISLQKKFERNPYRPLPRGRRVV